MRVAIIPARGGSRRIPRKNIREFHGKPMLEYAVKTAYDTIGLIDRVYVSTEDEEVAAQARASGAKVVLRPSELAADDVGTQEVMGDAIARLQEIEGGYVHYACCVYPCVPLLYSYELRIAYYAMRATGRYVYVPGWYYWGDAAWFKSGRALDDGGIKLEVEPWRYVDINEEADWIKAEKMYAALNGAAETRQIPCIPSKGYMHTAEPGHKFCRDCGIKIS